MILITLLQFTFVFIYMVSPTEGYNKKYSDSEDSEDISEEKRSIKKFPINDGNECTY
jgi:hypothetical protein